MEFCTKRESLAHNRSIQILRCSTWVLHNTFERKTFLLEGENQRTLIFCCV